MPDKGEVLPIGKGRIIKTMPKSAEKGARVAILSIGTRLAPAVEAARAVEASDATIGVTVADARWMMPDAYRPLPPTFALAACRRRLQP